MSMYSHNFTTFLVQNMVPRAEADIVAAYFGKKRTRHTAPERNDLDDLYLISICDDWGKSNVQIPQHGPGTLSCAKPGGPQAAQSGHKDWIPIYSLSQGINRSKSSKMDIRAAAMHVAEKASQGSADGRMK